MGNKVLLIIAVFLISFAATPALAQSIVNPPGGNTNPPAGTPNQPKTAFANTPGKNTNTPAGNPSPKDTSSKTPGGNTDPPEGNNKPPTITIKTPANNATYREAEPLTADYDCANADGTGFTVGGGKCVGTVGNGITMDTSTPGDHTFTVKATGDNGKQAELTYHYTVKEVKPQITIKTPQEGVTYNKNDRPKADYWCQNDDGSALAATGCRGSEVDKEPLDMTPGYHSFTVKATDNYGRKAELTHHYTVKDSPGDSGGAGGSGGGGSGSGGGSSGDAGGGGNDAAGGGGNDAAEDSYNINAGGVIGSIGKITYNVVGRIGDNVVIGSIDSATNNVVGSVDDTVGGLTQGKLPDTGGGWTILLVLGAALVGGGWFLVRLGRRLSG